MSKNLTQRNVDKKYSHWKSSFYSFNSLPDPTIFSQVRLSPEWARAPWCLWVLSMGSGGLWIKPAIIGTGSSCRFHRELWVPEVGPAALKGVLWVRKRAIVISRTWEVECSQFHVLVLAKAGTVQQFTLTAPNFVENPVCMSFYFSCSGYITWWSVSFILVYTNKRP